MIDPPTPASAPDPLTNVVVDLFQVHGALLRFGDQFVQDQGLTSASWQVLGGIERGGGQVTVPQIARRMGQARQSVQRQVNLLIQKGLVTIEENPDHRRSKWVVLTPDGQRVYAEISARWNAWATETSSPLSCAQLEHTRTVLAQLLRSLTGE